MHQYVHQVFINNQSIFDNEAHSPARVIGPPDANSLCSGDRNTWINRGDGVIEVSFKQIVIPTELKIWVTDNAQNSITSLDMIHIDRSITSLGMYILTFDIISLSPFFFSLKCFQYQNQNNQHHNRVHSNVF